MKKKTLNAVDESRICDICGRPSADWSEEPMAGQDHVLKFVSMCMACKETFEALVGSEQN